MNKVHKLIPLKEGTKIVDNGKCITVDIKIPLDRDDYAFLKKMYEMEVDVRGNIVDDEGMILSSFSNAIRSLGLNQVALEEIPKMELEDKRHD